MIVINQKVLKNASDISEAKYDILQLNNMKKLMQNSEQKAMNNFEKKLEVIESRLNTVSFPVTTTKDDCLMPHQTTNTGGFNCDNTAIIKHMPDNNSVEYNVNAMIGVGLCVNVLVKQMVRLNSNNYNPGAIKVEFYSLQNKINVNIDLITQMSLMI